MSKINNKVENHKKSILTTLGVHTAPESWSKYFFFSFSGSKYTTVVKELIITFKLKSKINVTNGIKNLHPKFTRTYHSKGELKTDTITCNVLGIRQNVKRHTRSQIPRRIQEESQIKEVMVKIEGCDSIEAACKVKNCLSYYGEILSDITEKCHYDPDPNALPVGNGSYQVKMKLKLFYGKF